MEVLLISEKTVKTITNLDENIAGKFLQSAIREAQEINLQDIIGTRLLTKLKELVTNNQLDDTANQSYQYLIEKIQYYLAYQTIAGLPMKVAYKISNMGVMKTRDENTENASLSEVDLTKSYYQLKADDYAQRLQAYLRANRASFPELGQNECGDVKPNLSSAATCPIWLGGARGKGRYDTL